MAGFNIGAAIGGAIAGTAGNIFAASSANKGLKKQIKYMKEAEKRAYAERERGRTAALQYVTPYTDDMGAREMIGRAMTSRPELLNDSQKIGLEDLTRDVTANLATSGMRGAGRGGQAVLADAQRRFRAGAFDQNQQRADLASRDLAAEGERARANAANIETGTSGAIAADTLNSGAAIGGGYADMGATNAGAILGSANLAGQTLGALSALRNSETKSRKDYPTLAYQV